MSRMVTALRAIGADGIRTGRVPVVAVVTDAIYPYHLGGKEIRYHELVRRWSKQFRIRVFTMRWWGDRAPEASNLEYIALCRSHTLYRQQRRSTRQALLFALSSLRLLFYRFDVIETDHMPFLHLFPLKLVAVVRRRRLVVTWHEVWGFRYWREYLGPLRGTVAGLIERIAVTLPDHVIAASPETAARLTDIAGDRRPITVAPNGIDVPLAGTAEAQPARTLITVGRLIEHKNVDLVVKAVVSLHQAGWPCDLTIVGRGPQEARLRSLVEDLRASSYITFRTDVESQLELYGLLKSARLFVSASTREGFGIAVLEALACGRRVVTTDTPDNLARHLVSASGAGTVCPHTIDALRTAIAAELTRDPGVPDAVAPEEWLSRYSWDAVAELEAAVLA